MFIATQSSDAQLFDELGTLLATHFKPKVYGKGGSLGRDPRLWWCSGNGSCDGITGQTNRPLMIGSRRHVPALACSNWKERWWLAS